MNRAATAGIFFAVLAAALYAVSTPLSKLLLADMPGTLMAGFLYIGAGVGMGVMAAVRKAKQEETYEVRLTRTDLPYTVAMIVLDIAAPICMLMGLRLTTAATASLLGNFEIVATALMALLAFKEGISPRLWGGILLVTVACALLSLEDVSGLRFSYGSLLILLACVCWGIENNCTRMISSKDPMQIVVLKGIFSGLGSVIIGLSIGERITEGWVIPAVLGLGFVAYGLSIYFYVCAQRWLGAAKTSAYYAVTPFLGALLSFIIFGEVPRCTYLIAAALMIAGAWLCANDKPLLKRKTSKKK